MAFTLTTIAPDPLGTTIVSDTTVNSTVQVPVTSGHSIYQIHIDNTANTSTAFYLNLVDANTGISAATTTDYRFYCAKGSTATYVIETGLVFSTGLSYWGVTSPAHGSTANPGSAVSVKILV